MKVLVIGTGGVGSVMAAIFTKNPEVSEVRLADVKLEGVKELADFLKSEKLSMHQVDATKPDEIAKVAKGVDVVVGATPPPLNLSIMDGALKAGANCQFMASGPPYDNIPKELALDGKWKEAGLTALIDTGFMPGISNVLAAEAAAKLDHVYDIQGFFTGAFEAKRSFARWSPETAWGDLMIPPTVYENGEWKTVLPYSDPITVIFPEPSGSQTLCLHPHEEVFTFPRFIGKGLRRVDVRAPYSNKDEYLVNLGFAGMEPINVKGAKVAPFDVLVKLAYLKEGEPPTLPEHYKIVKAGEIIKDYVHGGIKIEGEKGGKKVTYTFYYFVDLAAANERVPGASRTSYEAAAPAAINTLMLGRGGMAKGVYPPECLSPAERKEFLVKLAETGYKVTQVVETQLF